MTIRKTYTAKASGNCQRWIAGSFIPNGSGTISTKYGHGFTVARSAAGTYTVTLDAPFAQFVSITANCQFATADTDGHQVTVGTTSVSGKTFVIRHLASTDVSATDIAATDISTSGTANKIHFLCVVADSDVPGAGV